MARGIGGEGGAVGGRDPNAGGRSGGGNQGGRGGGSFGEKFHVGDFGSGSSRGVGGEGGARGGRDPNAGGGSRGGGGRGGGTFQGGTGATRDQMQEQDQIGANVANAQRDFNNEGNSLADTVGNFVAGMAGFNEQDPTEPGYSGPGMPGQTGQAGWGFDPAGLIGSIAGGAFGVPLVGMLADRISSVAGRPLEVSLGPSVFGGDGETTVTGGNFNVRDPNGDPGEFFGTTPGLGFIGGAAAGGAPRKTTSFGVDPAAPEPSPAPEQPGMELPDGLSPLAPPSGANFDVGNSGLTESQLASIFNQYGSKVYKGRNASRVVS